MRSSDVARDVFLMGGDRVEIMDDGVGGRCCCSMAAWICSKVNEDGSLLSRRMDLMLASMKLDMALTAVLFSCVAMALVSGAVLALARCIAFSVCGVGLAFGAPRMLAWILFMTLSKSTPSFCCWADTYAGAAPSTVSWVRTKKDPSRILCLTRFQRVLAGLRSSTGLYTLCLASFA